MALGKSSAIISFLLLAISSVAQIPTPIRSVSSLPATCKGGSAVQASDMVILVTGGVGVQYLCTATNVWSPVVGGGGSISGSPSVNTQVSGNGSAFFAQPKPVYDVRDWSFTCDGTSDNSGQMNTLVNSIGSVQSSVYLQPHCGMGSFAFPANVDLDFSAGGSIKPLTDSTTVPGNAVFDSGGAGQCQGANTSPACAIAVTPTAANETYVLACMSGFSSGATTVTSSISGDVILPMTATDPGQHSITRSWLVPNVAAGARTFTLTFAANLIGACSALPFSGLGPTPWMDGAGKDSVGNGTPMSSGASTFLAGSLLLAFGGQNSNVETCTAGAGYVQPAGLPGNSTAAGSAFCTEYKLSASAGSSTATQTLSSTPTTNNWAYQIIGIRPSSARIFVKGGIHNPDNHQIFENATGNNGFVDFTGNALPFKVYPEWWGASSSTTQNATTNTDAINAAIVGAYGLKRSNGTALSQYNKPLSLCGTYNINGELQLYHTNSFVLEGCGRLATAINQVTTNKRVIDGQSNAYGSIHDITFSTSAAQNTSNPLVDIDYNAAQGVDFAPQFIDFERVGFNGNNLAAIGFQCAKSGGSAQCSNVNFWDSNFLGATTACARFGTPSVYAQNALNNSFIQGDMQGCPLYGIAVYGGDVKVRDMTFENGFASQTGFDVYCEAAQFACDIQNVRSESRRLAAGNPISIRNSKTLNQSSFPTPGTSSPVFPAVASIIMGSSVGGDGHYYKITNNSAVFGGIGTPSSTQRASSGSATTVVNTNETIAGSVTIKTFVLGETVTQASTGATGVTLNIPTSTATVTGTNTSGQFVVAETVTQGTTGITAQVLSPTPNLANPTLPLLLTNLSGTADNSHTWVGVTSAAVYTPSAAPTFSVSNPSLTITAHTGAPDNTNVWTGVTSAAVYKPTAVPVGPGYTINAFTGFRASIMSGTNVACYGVITSNTATSIVVTSWLTTYSATVCTAPDSTSTFIVEPNWGTQFTSGGMTWADMNENGIEGSLGAGLGTASLDTVDIPGDKISIASANAIFFRNVTTTRNDWALLPSGNVYQTGPINGNFLDVNNRITTSPGGNARYQSWSLPRISGSRTYYSGAFQQILGTKALVWECGDPTGANGACNDVWIGGRSDPTAGNAVSRNILEFGGALGRAAALGTDQGGTDTDITGGPSTGSGTGGAINFWTSNPGGSSALVNAGLKRWTITGAGNLAATGAMNITTTGAVTAASATFSGPPSISTGTASNTDLAGRITLGGGTGTYTFAGTYATAPVCTATDTTAVNAVRAATSTTTLTLTGTGTDVIAFICVGLN